MAKHETTEQMREREAWNQKGFDVVRFLPDGNTLLVELPRRPFAEELEQFQITHEMMLVPSHVLQDAGIRHGPGGWLITPAPIDKELTMARARLATAEARIAELEQRLELAEAPRFTLELVEAPRLTLRADASDLWQFNIRSEPLAEPYPGLSQIPGARNDWAPEEPSTYAPDHGEDLEIDTAEDSLPIDGSGVQAHFGGASRFAGSARVVPLRLRNGREPHREPSVLWAEGQDETPRAGGGS